MFRNLTGGRGARVQKKSSFSARKKPFAYHFRPQLEALESRDLLSGTGLMAEYFNNISLTGTPALVRTDANVNFSWGTGSPAPGVVNTNSFGAHWEGEIKAVEMGDYFFRTIRDTDGGAKLWVNGTLVINNWTGSTTTVTSTIPINLAAGEKATIVLEYKENTNTATMQLQWKRPGQSTYAAIPSAQLYTVGEEFSGPLAGWNVLNSTNYPGIDKTGSTTPAAITANTAAFNAALAALGTGSNSRVLYIPAGTYRINSLLAVSEKTGLSIIGEDPSKVIIQWAGPSNGTMFSADHNTNLSLSRITWDGSGTADTAVIVHASGNASTQYTEYVDNVFKNCRIGLQLGTNPATGFGDMDVSLLTIRRCKFINDTFAGISVGDQNALTICVWDSEFNDCKYGVTTLFGGGWNGTTYLQGAGQFNVYHSIFRRSTGADIAPADAQAYSIRDCFSTGSVRFIDTVGNGGYPIRLTLQGNTILNTTDPTSVKLGLDGPMTLIDNVFVSAAGQTVAVVEMSGVDDKDLISVGNVFTVPFKTTTPTAPLNNWDNLRMNDGTGLPTVIRTRSVSDTVVSRTATVPGQSYTYANIPEPDMPTTAPNMRRSIYEVASGSSNATIQADLTNAAAGSSTGRTTTAGYLANAKPIVHLAQGGYNITTTLTIPARSDLQLLGDGQDLGDTNVQWDGVNGGTLLRVAGPSHATVSNIYLNGNQRASNVVTIDNADQAGGHVAVSELNSIESAQGTFVEGLDKTVVDLRNYFYYGDSDVGTKVVGGPLAQAGTPDPVTGITPGVTAKVNVFGNFGGGVNGTARLVDLSKGGTLGLYDTWSEGTNANLGSFTDKGTFTMQGGLIAGGWDATHPVINVNGWNGKATFLDVEHYGTFNVSGSNANMQTLVMGGVLSKQPPQTDFYTNNADPIISPNQGALYNQTADYSVGYPYSSLPNSGLSTDAFLTTMLTQVRAEDHFAKWQPQSFGVTDVHINHAWTRGSLAAGLHVTRYIAPDATATATSSYSSTLPILPLPMGGTSRADSTAVVGYEFQYQGATGDLVTSLGFFNANGSGALLNNHVVTLYSESGPGASSPTATLGSVTVNSGTGTAGQYDYVSLSSPVSLTNGAWYVVGSTVVAGGDPFLDTATITPHPLAANIYGRYHVASPTGYPENIGTPNYLGPSMQVSSVLRGPQNILSGGGLAGGVQGTDADNNMYLSGQNQLTPTITIDLGASYNITGFRQWNYNEISGASNETDRGIKTVNILTSADGTNYTSRGTFTFAQATGVGYEGEDQNAKTNGVVGTWTGVRYVKLQVLTNWGDTQFTGLSKIQFRTA